MLKKMEVKLIVPFIVLAGTIVGYILLSWCPTSVEYASQLEESSNKRALILLSSQLSNLVDIKDKKDIQQTIQSIFDKNISSAHWKSLDVSGSINFTTNAPDTSNIEPLTISYAENGVTLSLTYDFSFARADIESHAAKLAMLIMIGVIAFSALLWLATRHYIIKPVRNLIKTSNALAVGEYDTTLLPAPNSEVGALIESFSTMRTKLKDAQEKQEQHVQKITSLARQNILMSKIVKESALGIMIIDCQKDDFPIAYVNPSFQNITGYSLRDIAGNQYGTIFGNQTDTTSLEKLNKAVQNAESVILEAELYHHSGHSFWGSINGFPVYNKNGSYRAYSFIIEDISERKKTDAMKDGFISTVSHELRTPLTSIHGSLSLLNSTMKDKLPSDVKPVINIAHKNSSLLSRIVDDILDTEKLDSQAIKLNLEKQNIKDIIDESVSLLTPYADDFNIKLNVQSNTPPFNDVYVDKQRIIQVFSNILSNAIKFSPENTTVDINAYYYQDDYARIEFHDKGKGIPKEFKEDIFNKFVQHDVSNIRKTSGTGLGLYISKALIEKHEGQISFESTPDEGTKFYVDIPLISNLLRVAHAV